MKSMTGRPLVTLHLVIGVFVGVFVSMAPDALSSITLKESASSCSVVAFQDGQTASAGPVNANFSCLQDRIAALEEKLQYLSVVQGAVNGLPGPHVMITGANLHVRSGASSTSEGDCGATGGNCSGRGNLVIGYDEPRQTGAPIRSGSHNLIIGSGHNFSSHGGFVAGLNNTLTWRSASIAGGTGNQASGTASSIAGGSNNGVYEYAASIAGGRNNVAGEQFATVAGGCGNRAGGDLSHPSNCDLSSPLKPLGEASAVAGGINNLAALAGQTVAGGIQVSNQDPAAQYWTLADSISTHKSFTDLGTFDQANAHLIVTDTLKVQ